jgi:putative CocE/NonD family hydrolase
LSYLGFNQWCLLAEPPPELMTAVIASGPHDTGRLLSGSGVIALESALNFGFGVVHQEERGMLSGLVTNALHNLPKRQAVAGNTLPLSLASTTFLDGRAPWFEEWLNNPDPSDPYWDDRRTTIALERCPVPVLLFSGWQDVILDQTLEEYEALHARGSPVAMSVGPWTHGDLALKALGRLTRETLEWLTEHLAQDGPDQRNSPVKIHVTGSKEWRDLPSWPPPTSERVLYLHAGGMLSAVTPSVDSAPSPFVYDPRDPTPTVGGLTNSLSAGGKDNKAREDRADVVSFTTEVLKDPVEVVGSVVVELFHGTDNPFVDFFIRLCEVDGKGRSFNLCERNLRFKADVGKSVSLELSAIAHRFLPGTRIRIQISGGSHPQYARNLGTGDPQGQGISMVPSHRSISHGVGGLSQVRLPITTAS